MLLSFPLFGASYCTVYAYIIFIYIIIRLNVLLLLCIIIPSIVCASYFCVILFVYSNEFSFSLYLYFPTIIITNWL